MSSTEHTCPCLEALYARRTVLHAALSAGLGLTCLDVPWAQSADPREARPQEGDQFVFASGERQGKIVMPADLPIGGPPVTTYPMDPSTGVVRDGSRLNQVLLLRLNAADLAEETQARAAEGIVAYSAVCTHTGCDVWIWQRDRKILKCPCHDSEFDPTDGARVVGGPAPRRLPRLPLQIVEGVVRAAGSFIGRVGFKQS